jgi:predicted Na+-dependent transporter
MKDSEKSVVAVVGSYLLSVVLVQATDPLLSRIFPGEFVWGRVPSGTALIASTGLFVLVSILCAWLCAHFAPGRVARHVLWLVVVGEGIITLAIIHNWTQAWPLWYWLSWPLTWPVSCWIGLLLAGRRADSVTALIRT